MTPAPISVERLRELLDKATPEPWSQDHRRGKDGGYRTQVFDASGDEIATLAWHAKPPRYEDGRKIISTDRAENAELIVAMHEALPALLQQLAERGAEVERLRNGAEREQLSLLTKLREAQGAREEACGLLREVLVWRRTVPPIAETPRKDGGIFGRIAAFLAASGGDDNG